MENLTRIHYFLLSSFFDYSQLLVAEGVSFLETREILKRACSFFMLALLLMYQRQVHLSECAASLVGVDGVGDASSRCCITVAPILSFASMFGRNETCTGPKSSGGNT